MIMEKREPKPVGNPITVPGWLIAVFTFIGGVILGWFKGASSKGIAGMLGMAAMTGFKGFVMTAPDRATEWMKLAAEAFSVPSSAWAVFVSETMYQLTGGYVDPMQFVGQGVGPGSRQAIEALGEAYLTPMMGLILPRAGETSTQMGLTPEDGLNAAERFFGVNLEFQMKAWLLHLLGDTFSFGMWKAMKDLPNAISWSFGIGWLSWLVMGTPFRMGIADPLEILYNRMYRPYRLSIAKLADAFWRGLLSRQQFYSGMKDFGVLDPQMDIIMEMERSKITDAQAYRLYRMEKMSFEDLVSHQRAQGHSPEESQTLATEMIRREVIDLLEDVAKTATKHYKDRRMSDSELRGFLREAGWTDEESTLIIQDLNMQMALVTPEEAKERVLTPANIARLYQLGKRTRQWTETKLAEHRFKVDEIPDFLELYEPKVPKPEEPRELSAGLVGTVYRRGLISLDEAKRRWADLDYRPEDLVVLAMRYAPPVPPPPLPPREFSPSEIGRLYRDRKITREIALERLEADPIRFRPDDAVLYLDSFYTPIEEVVPPPEEVPAYVVGGLYKQGLETEEVFRAYLVELRYTDRGIEWMVEHYAPPVPPPPLPPREFTPSEMGRLWRDHYMTTETALGRLTGPRIRMTQDDAEMYLEAFYHPVEVVEPPPREAPASVIGGLYQEGLVTLSDFEEHLDTLRYSLASKGFLTLHYQPPIPPPPLPPREFSPTIIGKLFSTYDITLREALDRLTGPQVNMTRDDSIIYLKALYVPIEIKDIGILYSIGIYSSVEAVRLLEVQIPGISDVEAIYYLDTLF